MRYWEVLIGKWHKPWNRELESELTRKEKRAIKGLAWAEQPQTINEVGSTFTIQGFDLNYAGVSISPNFCFVPSDNVLFRIAFSLQLSKGSNITFPLRYFTDGPRITPA